MRREQILQIAALKFVEKGYNLSLSEVAKEAGIRKQTLYNYFEGKDELLLEVIKLETESYFDDKRVEFKGFETLPSEERLKNMFMSIVKYFSKKEKILFWRWMILVDSEALKLQIRAWLTTPEKRFMETLYIAFESGMKNQEIKEQPIQPLLSTYYALIHGVIDGILVSTNEEMAKQYSNNVWEVFWKGRKSEEEFIK